MTASVKRRQTTLFAPKKKQRVREIGPVNLSYSAARNECVKAQQLQITK